MSTTELLEHPPRRYCEVLQEKYALHQLEPVMVPCPSSKTLGPATNSFEHQAQITAISTFTQECPDFLPSCQDCSRYSRYASNVSEASCAVPRCKPTDSSRHWLQGTVRRGRSRPRASFAWALIKSPCCNIFSFLLYYYSSKIILVCRLNLPDYS